MSKLTYPLVIAGAIVMAVAIVIFGTEFVLRRRGHGRFWGRLVTTALALLGLSVGAMNMSCPKPTCYETVDVTKHRQVDIRETHKRLVQQFEELKKMHESGAVKDPAFAKAVEALKADLASLRNSLKSDQESVVRAGLTPDEIEKLCSEVDALLGQIDGNSARKPDIPPVPKADPNRPACYAPMPMTFSNPDDLKASYERMKQQYDKLKELRAAGTVKGEACDKIVGTLRGELRIISDTLSANPDVVEKAKLNKQEAQTLCTEVDTLLKKIGTEK